MGNFSITSVSGKVVTPAPETAGLESVAGAAAAPENLLGPLAKLVGTWHGKGFNQIWRPVHGTQDRFLELNETTEELQFIEIPGEIPNRGLLQDDINLHGITYLQKISDVNVLTNGKPSGIHIEPGIWINVPATLDPKDDPTVARMANIPHGTSLVAQGTSFVVPKPIFQKADITPFVIGDPTKKVPFPEQDLSKPSAFRTQPGDIPNVTQAMVDDPNSVLAHDIAGKNITSTTVLAISTVASVTPASGGGTANIAFLLGAKDGPNAVAAQMDAIFWIEEYEDSFGFQHVLLQYTQTVLLNFNGLSWPHVSVATLHRKLFS
jgi:hypothetical protein